MSPAMAREESDFAARELPQHKRIRGIAKGRFHALFMDVGKSGHRVEPAAAYNSDLCLRQCRSDQQARGGLSD